MIRRVEPVIITDWEKWLKHAETIDPTTWLALDLETTGLSPWKDSTAVVGLYDPSQETAGILHFPRTYVQKVSGQRAKLPQPLIDWLGQRDRRFVAHNAVGFDAYFLQQDGVDVFGPEWYDSLTGEGVCLKAARKDIKRSLAVVYKRRLGMDLKEKIDHKTWQNDTLTLDQYKYVAGDIVYLPMLREAQYAEINEKEGDRRVMAMDVEQYIVPVVMAMTINGFPVRINTEYEPDGSVPEDYRQGFRYYIEERMRSLEKTWQITIKLLSGGLDINTNSPAQVKVALEAVGITDLESTNIETLTGLRDVAIVGTKQHRMITSIMMLRTAGTRAKLYGDDDQGRSWFERFVDIQDDGTAVVHPRYWQVGTETGRFSCSDPNMQQVGKDCRTFFGEREGYLCLTADYSQLEVAITAWLANDKAFLDAILTGDIHTAMARRIWHIPEDVPREEFESQRGMAKGGVFTFLFGGGYKKLYQTAKTQGSDVTLQECAQFEADFFAALPGLQKKKTMANHIAKNRLSHTVIMPHGLIRHLAGSELRPATIMNTEVQGGAASGLKLALAAMRKIGIMQYINGVVHDEVVSIAPVHMFDTDPANLYADPTWTSDGKGGFVIEGELNRYIHWAMKEGMYVAFPGEKFGIKFPIKVGLNLGPRWYSKEMPHTGSSISKKALAEKVIPGANSDERAQAKEDIVAPGIKVPA